MTTDIDHLSAIEIKSENLGNVHHRNNQLDKLVSNDGLQHENDKQKFNSSNTSSATVQGHKLNISLKGIQDLDENQIIHEELLYYDASRVFGTNGNEIMREINQKKKIVVSKVVYSNGMYNKFTIVARCYRTALNEI